MQRAFHRRYAVFALFLVFTFFLALSPAYAVRVTNTKTIPGFDEYLIEEPDIETVPADGEPRTYSGIRLAPGDTVVVTAGGCVAQSSGVWIPYASGIMPLSTIYVSGTGQFVKRQELLWRVLGKPLLIDRDFPAQQLVFQLGYWRRNQSFSYVDSHGLLAGNPACDVQWPRIDPDTGQPSPKKTAYVVVSVTHGNVQADLSQLKELDILPVHGFLDNLPVNPIWGGQALRCGLVGQLVGGIRSWKGCKADPVPACKGNAQSASTQTVIRDNSFWCATRDARIDFARDPVVYYASMDFEDHGFDDDYAHNLHSDAGELQTDGDRVHFEHDSDETIDPITSKSLGANQWWIDFRNEVDNDQATARTWFRNHGGGEEPFGVVVGMPGIDCWHGRTVEIHPAYALAVRIRENPERWVFFYRNFGNNGFCGDTTYGFPGRGGRYTLLLPPLPPPQGKRIAGATPTGDAIKWWKGGGDAPQVDWKLQYMKGQGTLVTIQLPSPQSKHAGIAGVIDISYNYADEPGAVATLDPCVVSTALGRFCTTATKGPIAEPREDDSERHEKTSLFLDSFDAESRPVYRKALQFLENQIGFRLGDPAPSGIRVASLPVNCSLTDAPGLDNEEDWRPQARPVPRHSAIASTYCALFRDLAAFPTEICADGTAPDLESLPECRNCPPDAPGLLRHHGEGRGVLAGWVLPAGLEPGRVLELVVGEERYRLTVEAAAGPLAWRVAVEAPATGLASLFGASGMALVRFRADGALGGTPATAEGLEEAFRALFPPQEPFEPREGGSCPEREPETDAVSGG
jgi:hypothetical protein